MELSSLAGFCLFCHEQGPDLKALCLRSCHSQCISRNLGVNIIICSIPPRDMVSLESDSGFINLHPLLNEILLCLEHLQGIFEKVQAFSEL